jgi:hypothetical protein
MARTIIVLCFIASVFVLECAAEGLDTLIDLGRSQAQIQDQYREETRAFEKVKKGIEEGAIVKGQTRDSIRSKYGEPIVAAKDLDGKREDWVYKPASSSFFDGIRATLIFTEEGLLDEIRLGEDKGRT